MQAYTIPETDILTRNIRPLRHHIANLRPDWRDLLGSVVIHRDSTGKRPDHIYVARYWYAALKAQPWLPYVLAPDCNAVLDIAASELPLSLDQIALGQHLALDVRHHLRGVLRKWNRDILLIGLASGVESARITAHIDALRIRVLGSVSGQFTLAQ